MKKANKTFSRVSSSGVFVVVSCPPIEFLRRSIIEEYFRDCILDRFLEYRISMIMEEFLYMVYSGVHVYDPVYNFHIDDILTFVSHHVRIEDIKSIQYFGYETIIINCKGMKE